MRFFVEWKKEITVVVEAESEEVARRAAEKECDSGMLEDYSCDGWVVESVLKLPDGEPPVNGVTPDGEMAHIDDARRLWLKKRILELDKVICEHCDYVGTGEDVYIDQGYRNPLMICPECGKTLDLADQPIPGDNEPDERQGDLF